MSVTKKELDDLFMSSNNDVKDKVVRTIIESSHDNGISSSESLCLSEPARTGIVDSRPAKKESKAIMPEKEIEILKVEAKIIMPEQIKTPKIEEEEEDELGIKGKSFKDRKKNTVKAEEEDVAPDVLDVNGEEVETEDFVDETNQVKTLRVPFEEDEEPKHVDKPEVAKSEVIKPEVITPEDEDTETVAVENKEDIEENRAIREDLKKICTNERFLDDPRYVQFYTEKKRAKAFLEMHAPIIDYKKMEKQLYALHVPVNEEKIMTLGEFNEKIQKLQAIRNRLSEIRSLSIKDYVLKKRIVKLLEDCLMKQSPEKSNDKRTGEVQIHMADMEYDLALSESFFRDIDQIIENTTCAHEALSRQITCFQERNKEINRGQEPILDNSNTHLDSLLATSPMPSSSTSIPKANGNRGYKNWEKVV